MPGSKSNPQCREMIFVAELFYLAADLAPRNARAASLLQSLAMEIEEEQGAGGTTARSEVDFYPSEAASGQSARRH